MKKKVLWGLSLFIFCLILSLSSASMAVEVGDILKSRDGMFKIEIMGDTSSRSMELDSPVEIISVNSTREDADPNPPFPYNDWIRDVDGDPTSDNSFFAPSVGGSYSETLDELDETITMEKFLLKFTVAPMDMLGFYVKLGLGRINTDWDHAELREDEVGRWYDGSQYEDSWTRSESEVLDFNGGRGDYGPAVGIGARFYFVNQPSFNVGVDAQYNYLQSDNVWEMNDSMIYNRYDPTNGTLQYSDQWQQNIKTDATAHEFQLALIARKTMGDLSAYGGVKLSYLAITYEGSFTESYTQYDINHLAANKTKNWSGTKDFEYDSVPDGYPVGLYVGADYKLTRNIGAKFEARFMDELGLSGGAYVNF